MRFLPTARTTYTNPVQRGDFPDPSVVRVGERDYYAVTTSTEWAPYFPIFHSRDLVTWTRVGAVFHQRPAWAVGQFWAPEISYRDGTFFVYYTARRRNGPLTIALATAPRPCGPWTDHGPLVGQQLGSIDATTVVEAGQPWLVWKEDGNATGRPTTLWAQRLSADGTSTLGERTAVLVNDAVWEDRIVEAPSILARDGWFYLFYSGNKCCGESCRYAVGVARARRIVGPWQKCPRNPIMSENASFRGPGHGSVVETADGRTYYLYHAYANVAGATTVGRELMLDEVMWNADGWPSINGGRGPSRRARTPYGWHVAAEARTAFQADLSKPLDATWQWPQHQSGDASVDTVRRNLVLHTPLAKRTDWLDAVIARPARSLDYTATATLDPRLERGVMASLAAYGNRANALGIGVRDRRIVAWTRRRGAWQESDLGPIAEDGLVHLRLDAIWGKAYRVAYSRDGKRWTDHAEILDGTHLPPWDRGVRIALCAGGRPDKRVAFRSLRIEDVREPVASLDVARSRSGEKLVHAQQHPERNRRRARAR